jgi:cellulose synthase/poly-beta-1,6-N-acetylglucosamine synthase-like glycosyltransferase
MSSFYKLFFLLNLFFTLFFLLTQKYLLLLNFQIASISAILIAIGSFLGYKKEVVKKSQEFEIDNEEDKDTIDKIEDPYNIFDEEINEKELSKEDIQKIIAQEKSKIKKFSIKNIFLTIGAIFSPFRIIGYLVLIIGFFWLKANHFLEIFSYLFGIFLLPLSVLLFSFKQKSL